MQMLKWPDTFSLNVTMCGAAGAFGFNYRWGWHRAALGFTAATGQRLKGECSFNTRMMVIPLRLVSKRVVQQDKRLFSLNLRQLNHGLLQFLEVSCRWIPILYFAEGIIIWEMGPFWCWSLDSMCFRKPKGFWCDVKMFENLLENTSDQKDAPNHFNRPSNLCSCGRCCKLPFVNSW